MKATEDLRNEHRAVIRMLAIMRAMATRIGAGEAPDAQDLAEIGEFLQVFVDRCHHGKEEGHLFPALEAAAPELMSVTDSLRAEHVRGRELTATMMSLAGRVGWSPGEASGPLVDAIADYTLLLRSHIHEEDRDCFAPADRILPPDVQQRLAEAYDRLERDVIGEGRHEEFHRLLDRLDARYMAHANR